MTKMDIIQYYRLRNGELLALFNEISSLARIPDPTLLKYDAELNQFDKDWQEFDRLFSSIRSSSETQKLSVLNTSREQIFKLIVAVVQKTDGYPLDINILNASREFQRVLDTHGDIISLAYQAKTTTLRAFLSDLKNPDFHTYSTCLRLDQWILDLEDANNLFDEVYTQRQVSKEQSIPQKGATEECRAVSEKSYEALRDKINALAILEGAEPYQDMILQINGAIKDTIDNAKHMRKKDSDDE